MDNNNPYNSFFLDIMDEIFDLDKISKTEITNYIIKNIMKGSLSKIIKNITEKNESFIYRRENDIYQISTWKSQINNPNLTIIIYNKCEEILKRKYTINENETLILFKVEHIFQELVIPIVEYLLFSPDGKIKFDLNICNNVSFTHLIPVIINENELYKYDPNHSYYKDNCYPNAIQNGLDMTIYERKEDYNNNRSLCETNCTYINYNNVSKRVECECNAKHSINLFWNITIDKKKLLDSFTNVKKIINFDVIKCYKLLFTKEGLISNIGSYILFGNIFIAFLIMLIFIFRGYGLFIGKMKNVLKIKEKSNNTNKKNILTNNLGFKRKNKINKKKKNFSKGNNPPIKLKDKKHSSKQSKRKNNNLKNNIRKTAPSSKIE